MSIRERLSGNEAVATAMRQINPDVVAAYPITPSTEIPQYFSTFVANGSVNTEFVPVESEHSAMSACIGASASGARVVTATSSQGLAYMFETLYIASGMRLPITLACVNRTLSAPINIHNDHSDSMGVRDCGWMQLYCETAQEAYDNFLIGMKVAEKTSLPIMVCYDGFITSHAVENISLLEDDVVKEFIGEFKPEHSLLDPENLISMGPLDLQDFYFEHKKQIADAMRDAKKVIEEVSEEFYKISGRKYDLVEKYNLDDAEIAIVCLNSTAGTTKEVVDNLRKQGIKAGLLKPRAYRPFPQEEIASSLKNVKAVAILDKTDSVNGYGAPLYTDITSALFTNNINLKAVNYIYGLGGRDVKTTDIEKVFSDLQDILKENNIENHIRYLGVRE